MGLAKPAVTDDELDVLSDLGDEIATLAAHIHAATYRLLTLIADFDRLQGWEPEGHRSCAHWLAFRTGIDLGAAREKVRAARALTELPQISASMEQGELSFTKVRALTRVATPESEGALLELALCSTAAQLERTARAWRLMCRFDENELEKIRHRSRCFSVFPDEEGMYVVRGRLDPEVGAMLMRAIDAANDALFRANTSEEIEPKQRRADAVGLLAERALAVGFGQAERSGAAVDDRTSDAKSDLTSSAKSDLTSEGITEHKAGADVVPLSGTRAERYQVVLALRRGVHVGERERAGAFGVGGRDTRFRGNVPEAVVRREHRTAHQNPRRQSARQLSTRELGPRRRAQDTDDSACAQAGFGGPGPWMPIPGLWAPLHGRPPREALGRRRRDEVGKSDPALPFPPPIGARGGIHRALSPR